MIIKQTKIAVFVASLFFCVSIWASAPQFQPPVAMLRATADRMIAELNQNRGRLKNNDKLIYGIVRKVLMPHFDMQRMSRSVVGLNYWDQSAPNLQKQFIDEFSFYVVRTYSAPLSSYDGEQINFYPIRGYVPGQSVVQVNSDILRKNGPKVPIGYRLYGSGANWMIYDFSVEGVSIVQNYRAQFASTLQRSGLSGLVIEISARNRGMR